LPIALSTPAILLRSVAYGEADRVVTLLGRNTGRVSALARGARRSQRRFGGGLGPAATGQASLRDRPGAELLGLEAFEVIEARIGLGQDLARAAHAAYALELCEKLCAPRQAEPAVYDWLDELLGRVERGAATALRLRVFELGLLGRLGLAPALMGCAGCGRAHLDGGDEPVRWQPARGGAVCARCVRGGPVISAATRRALARLQRLSLADAETDTPDADLDDACRKAIGELVRLHLSGPLRSLVFMEKMAAAGRAGRGV
jgi:DNA repair protein RecO (recombination protein O)